MPCLSTAHRREYNVQSRPKFNALLPQNRNAVPAFAFSQFNNWAKRSCYGWVPCLFLLCKSPDTQGLRATSRCGLQSTIIPEAVATYSLGWNNSFYSPYGYVGLAHWIKCHNQDLNPHFNNLSRITTWIQCTVLDSPIKLLGTERINSLSWMVKWFIF